MAYRRSGTKGRKCVRRRRVRGVLRCAKFGPRRSGGSRKSRRGYRGRKPAGMARSGSKCVSFRRVRVRGGGMQRRCRKYRSR
jgi:hypothetical protein